MKNPKWRCAYPGTHKVKYGGKFLTNWTGYNLTLLPSEYGTISGDRLRGYEDEVCHLTAYPNTLLNQFEGYDLTGGGYIQGNDYTYTTANATAQGRFSSGNSALIYKGPTAEHEGGEEVLFSGTVPSGAWIAMKATRRAAETGLTKADGMSAYYSYGFGSDYTYGGYGHNECIYSRENQRKTGYSYSAIYCPRWYWENAQGDVDWQTIGGNGAYVWNSLEGSTYKHQTLTVLNTNGANSHNVKLICPISGERSYFYINNRLTQTRFVSNRISTNAMYWGLHDGSGNFDCSLWASTGHDVWGYAPDGISGTSYLHQYWKNFQVALFKDLTAAEAW